MTATSVVDAVAEAVSCAEGQHRWDALKAAWLWECAACGYRPSCDGGRGLRR